MAGGHRPSNLTKLTKLESSPTLQFSFSKENNMTTLLLIIGIPLGLYGLWFLVESIRYVGSGEYEVDKRLRKVTH
jgi:hypothetical protein